LTSPTTPPSNLIPFNKPPHDTDRRIAGGRIVAVITVSWELIYRQIYRRTPPHGF
jgi:hypothetical protein